LIRNLTTFLITFLLAAPAIPIELFRYRGAAKDGGTLEYVFEAGEQNFWVKPVMVCQIEFTEWTRDDRRKLRWFPAPESGSLDA
jgi:hypothetical protein